MLGNYEAFEVEIETHVATVWMSNPAAGATPWAGVLEGAPVVMHALDGHPDIRAVVLAARGPHFTVGLDLKAMAHVLLGTVAGRGPRRACQSWSRSRIPACGHRCGTLPQARDRRHPRLLSRRGIDLITACDIRVAAADAVFSCVKHGSQSWPTLARCSACRRSSAKATLPSWSIPVTTYPPSGQGDPPGQRRVRGPGGHRAGGARARGAHRRELPVGRERCQAGDGLL